MKTVYDLDLINFSDCHIHNMIVDLSKKQVQADFDYLYVNVNSQWDAIDQLTLAVSNWKELIAERFQNDVWTIMEPSEFETFKEIHEAVYQDDRLVLEGFSAQSGYWLKYTFTGNIINIAISQKMMA